MIVELEIARALDLGARAGDLLVLMARWGDASVRIDWTERGLDVATRASDFYRRAFEAGELPRVVHVERTIVASEWSLRGVCLRTARLVRCDAVAADLCEADLRGADLEGADLRCASLRGADLRGAHLADANLEDADLEDADLEGADLRGSRGRGVTWAGAHLAGVRWGMRWAPRGAAAPPKGWRCKDGILVEVSR